MRDVLFRAWDTQRREYLSGGAVFIAIQPGKFPSNTFYLDILKNPDVYRDRFILEQYTGLPDKNGRKIWEGDILKVFTPYNKATFEDAVHYRDGGFFVGTFPLYNVGAKCNSNEFEVVGTIHDETQNT